MSPVATVVVVTHNSAQVISACLDPLASCEEVELVVVDNASTDGTVTLVRAIAPRARVIVNDANTGFASAVNQGARGATAPVLVLVNPDAVVEAPCVLALARRVQAQPRWLIAARECDPSGTVSVGSGGRWPTAWRMCAMFFGVQRLFPARRWAQGVYLAAPARERGVGLLEVDWISGACLAVGTEFWRELGGFTERWFMYGEDIDLCWRAGLSGGRCWVDRDLAFLHRAGTGSSDRDASMESSWILHLEEFAADAWSFGRLRRLWWRFVVILGLLWRAGIFGLQGLAEGARGTVRWRSARIFARSAKDLALKSSAQRGIRSGNCT